MNRNGKRIPEADRPAVKGPAPVRNDSLKKAMEAFKKEPGRERNVEVLNQVVKATFLAPVSMDRKPEVNRRTGDVIIDEGTEIRFELISNRKEELYYPLFTDGIEMRKLLTDRDQQILKVSFADIATMIEAQKGSIAGFVIDPAGANMTFPTEMVIKMKREMEAETARTEDAAPEEDAARTEDAAQRERTESKEGDEQE